MGTIYKNPNVSVDERVEDLLSLMTLKEKVGQVNQYMYGWDAYDTVAGKHSLTDQFRQEIAFGEGVGAIYGIFRADPWSTQTFGGIEAKDSAKIINEIQSYIMDNTRLGIPALFSEECPHGHQALDGTTFPTNIGIASAWNPQLYTKVCGQIATELRSRGATLGLISSLDLVQDPRWGRSEECYSEDPYLSASMAESAVYGLQGREVAELQGNNKVVAILKHFCAQGATIGGHNGISATIGEREMRELHIPSIEAGIKAGALGCMAAYNDIDGVPCHMNKHLLTDILREELGFEGLVMSDGKAVDFMKHLCGSYEKAAALAIEAGVDLNLWNEAFLHLETSVEAGMLDVDDLDEAVRRILRIKFKLGLFENPYVDENLASQVVANKEAKALNLQIAEELIVMLENRHETLPIKKDVKKIAVIGPNANNRYNQLGDYTQWKTEKEVITVLQGVQEVFKDIEVVYEEGCRIREKNGDGIEAAKTAAEAADIVVLVLGGSSARAPEMKYGANGAVIGDATTSDMDCGEGKDVAQLELGGIQEQLAKEILAVGKPVITVLIQGRPYAVEWLAEESSALLCAWYPGDMGGLAIANVLAGKVNPSGKLSVSMPRSSAQLPVYYNYKSTLNYVDMPAKPLYPFGYGKSYTTFGYSPISIVQTALTKEAIEEGATFEVSVTVTNTGDIAGSEVVQLYIHGSGSFITRRVKELKGFEKVSLQPGESKVVNFNVGHEALAIWNLQMQHTVEPGSVQIMVGSSSDCVKTKEVHVLN